MYTSAERPRAARWPVTMAVAMLATAVSIVLPGTGASADPNLSGPTFPTSLTVRGSVEQIYVLNAGPGEAIRIDGVVEATANSEGAKLLRDVEPGDHTVQVGSNAPEIVSVDAPSVAEGTRFDTAGRNMATDALGDPVDGYLETADGTLLGYRVELPDVRPASGSYDVAVLYSGYRAGLRPAEDWEDALFTDLTALGYAVVGVNMRGSGCSGGAFDVMEPLVGRDGYDVIETIAEQDWSEEIAMVGASWLGLSQLFVAQHRPPSLDAIAPGAAVTDFYRDVAYPGGVPAEGFLLDWWGPGRDVTNQFEGGYTGDRALPLVDEHGTPTTCALNQALRHDNRNMVDDFSAPENATYNDYWRDRTVDVSQIEVPTLLVNSWHDEQTGSRAAVAFDQIPSSVPKRMIAVPAMHGAYTGVPEVWAEVETFLDVYLDPTPTKTADYEDRSAVEVMLENDRYLHRDRFDPAADPASQTFVLGDNLESEREAAATSSFFYTPGSGAFYGAVNHDGSSFVSDVLDEQLVMAGSGSVDLRILAESADVDLEVSLVDVRPDGQEMLVQSGWLRASHRSEVDESGADQPVGNALRPYHDHTAAARQDLVVGQWNELRVELLPFAHVFRPGSRIKLVVDAPGGSGQQWWAVTAAPQPHTHVTIGHSAEQPSEALLPVIANPVVKNGQGQLASPSASLADCVLPPFANMGTAIVAAWWHPCRATPTIESITADHITVTDGNLVSITSQSVGAPWNVAVLHGPRLLSSGAITDSALVLATGTNSFRAPPGTHHYTLSFANSGGVEVHETVEIDVPGFDQDVLTLPQQPTTNPVVSWSSPGDHWWVSIDGLPANGSQPVTDDHVAIDASLLTPGTHTVQLTTCTTVTCDSEHGPTSPIAGTVTYHTAPAAAVTGIRNQSSLIATITPASGPPMRVYSPYGGVVWSLDHTNGATVAAGDRLARVLLDGETRESMQIIVG